MKNMLLVISLAARTLVMQAASEGLYATRFPLEVWTWQKGDSTAYALHKESPSAHIAFELKGFQGESSRGDLLVWSWIEERHTPSKGIELYQRHGLFSNGTDHSLVKLNPAAGRTLTLYGVIPKEQRVWYDRLPKSKKYQQSTEYPYRTFDKTTQFLELEGILKPLEQ